MYYMQETYGLKIEKITLYRARAKARLEVFGEHSKGYHKLFEYAAAIHKVDSEQYARCCVMLFLYPTRYYSNNFLFHFLHKKYNF